MEKDLTLLIGSDAHYEINTVTTAHLAFVELAKQLQPDVIVMNGDLLDGSSISRHAPLRMGGEANCFRARVERSQAASNGDWRRQRLVRKGSGRWATTMRGSI